MQSFARHRQAGLSLVEMSAVLCIAGVLVGSAVPDLLAVRKTQALNLAASQLRTDIQLARSAAVSMDRTIRLSMGSGAGASCYVIHSGSETACSCGSGAAQCSPGTQLIRAVHFEPGGAVQVSSNSSSLAFDGTQGTVTPTGTVSLTTPQGDQLKVVINVMGRARTCKSAGAITGHPGC